MTWINEIFNMFDCNGDKKISLRELIKGCAPDINCDKKIDDKEFGYGKSTAKYWLANIICAVPHALDDCEIDLAELKKAKNCPDPKPTPNDISKAESILSTIDYE